MELYRICETNISHEQSEYIAKKDVAFKPYISQYGECRMLSKNQLFMYCFLYIECVIIFV